jgi:hypothetical protein
MALRPTSTAVFGLVVSMLLTISAGCGGKPAEPDTAVVVPSKAPAEPAKAESPAPEPAKEAPRN